MQKRQPQELVFLPNVSTGVWDYTIEYFEKSLAETCLSAAPGASSSSYTLFAKILARLGLLRNLWRGNGPGYFVPLMGPAEYRLFPYCYSSQMVVYCYDCWPPYYDRWEAVFKRHRIGVAFFSARQSAGYFAARMPHLRAIWLPEATEPRAYQNQRMLHERDIAVLELGRRYEWWHQQVVVGLERAGVLHRYENPRGQTVFPTRTTFVSGLGNSRISVCFPASWTTPERAGKVETVTHRYFEAMASGCLILGHCPAELEDLFGYNPVVEITPDAPLEQVLAILANIQSYQQLVARNYQRLLEVGTWQARVRTLCQYLNQAGFKTHAK